MRGGVLRGHQPFSFSLLVVPYRLQLVGLAAPFNLDPVTGGPVIELGSVSLDTPNQCLRRKKPPINAGITIKKIIKIALG